jgi:hypothetical protein
MLNRTAANNCGVVKSSVSTIQAKYKTTTCSSAAQTFVAGSEHAVIVRWTNNSTEDLRFDGVDSVQTSIVGKDFGGAATQISIGCDPNENITLETTKLSFVGPVILIPENLATTHPLMNFHTRAGDIASLIRDMPIGGWIAPLSINSRSYLKVAS